MPADPVVALLPVDAAREAERLRAIPMTEWVWSDAERIFALLDAFARHHLAHRTPAPAGDVRVDEAQVRAIAADIYAEVAIEPLGDLSQRRDQVQTQWFDAVRSALTTHLTTPDSSAVSGSAEGLREAWMPKIGDRVKVSEHAEFAADWQGMTLWVARLAADERGRGINVTVSEQWPIPSRHTRRYMGQTEGFIVGRTDGLLDDLEPAPAALTEGQQS